MIHRFVLALTARNATFPRDLARIGAPTPRRHPMGKSSKTVSLVLTSLFLIGANGQITRGDLRQALPEPDHLVPVHPYNSKIHVKYQRVLDKKLIGNATTPILFQAPKRWGTALMVYRPSFEPEECLVLQQDKATEFKLTLSRADWNLWYSLPENNEEKTRKAVKVRHFTAPLPAQAAERVYKLWERMLQSVHYPNPADLGSGNDGEIIEFRYKGMFGQTWSPVSGAPRLLVDLGNALRNGHGTTSRSYAGSGTAR